MKVFIILAALLFGVIAGPLECPYVEIARTGCSNDATCQAINSNTYCKFDGTSGTCVSNTYECTTGRECFQVNGQYGCKVPEGGTCSSTSQCAVNQKCINSKCTCSNVPDFGTDMCYLHQDGAIYTNCGAQNRTCYGSSNFPYPYGSCISMEYQPANNDADCYPGTQGYDKTTNSQYECSCRQKNHMPYCRHYTILKQAMTDYKNCMLPFTTTCAPTNIESCCDTAASVCKVYLNDGVVSQYYPNMGDVVQGRINYLISRGNDCGFKDIMSDQCNVNLLGVY